MIGDRTILAALRIPQKVSDLPNDVPYMPAADMPDDPQVVQGPAGKSALDLYREQTGNPNATLTEFMAYLEGPAGQSARFVSAQVQRLAPTENPMVLMEGPQDALRLTFSIPDGQPGKDAPPLSLSVRTLDPGSPATVEQQGSQVTLGIPAGRDGKNAPTYQAQAQPLAAGQAPTVTLSGDMLTFGIPAGRDGRDAIQYRFQAQTLAPGSQASATLTDDLVTIGVPAGQDGKNGTSPQLPTLTARANTLAAGQPATATWNGNELTLGIPQGQAAVFPTLTAKATQLAAGQAPTASFNGNQLDLGLPAPASGPAMYAKVHTTNATGALSVTWPTGRFGAKPVVTADVISSDSTYSYKVNVLTVTATGATFQVTRSPMQALSLLGLSAIQINQNVTTAQEVHVRASAATD